MEEDAFNGHVVGRTLMVVGSFAEIGSFLDTGRAKKFVPPVRLLTVTQDQSLQIQIALRSTQYDTLLLQQYLSNPNFQYKVVKRHQSIIILYF